MLPLADREPLASAQPPAGLHVANVRRGSVLDRLGVRAGDRIVAIDDLVPRDLIDLQLELPSARRLLIQRPDSPRPRELRVPTEGVEAADLSLLEPVPGGIRECNNHCEFCFIRGLPPGLRPSLYVFDDDYRYSFLWGNFLTLTNLSETDWARIGYQRLSPLNVSVHATEPSVRRRLLNNRHAPDVLPQLRRLGELGIQVNTQIVLCPGINDREVLDRTIGELASLHPSVQSVSVVPVGLTRFSKVRHIRVLQPDEAAAALAQVEAWQARLRPTLGVGLVYASDELYVQAGRREVPPAVAYDGFPVLSNGVGMLRSMLDEWRRLLKNVRTFPAARDMAWLTGRLAAPALVAMADAWAMHAGWRPHVISVANHVFGEQVTVSGLLAGADLQAALEALPAEIQDVVLPRSAFGFDGHQTLDGVSAATLGTLRERVYLASTPAELLEILATRAAA